MNRPMTLKIFGGEEELGEDHSSVRSTHLSRWVEHHLSATSRFSLVTIQQTNTHAAIFLLSSVCTLDADDTVDAPPTPFLYLSPPTHPYSIVCTERKKKAACERNRWYMVLYPPRKVGWADGSVVRSPLPLILLLPQKSSTSLDDSLKFTK